MVRLSLSTLILFLPLYAHAQNVISQVEDNDSTLVVTAFFDSSGTGVNLYAVPTNRYLATRMAQGVSAFELTEGGDTLITELGTADSYLAITRWKGFDGALPPSGSDSSRGEVALPQAGWWLLTFTSSVTADKAGPLTISLADGALSEIPSARSIVRIATAGNETAAAFSTLYYSDGTAVLRLQVKHASATVAVVWQTLQFTGLLLRPD